MTRLRRLRNEAAEAARWRGHSLNPRWTRYHSRAMGNACTTPGCVAWVNIDTHPAPNGIDIGGPAVAVNCPDLMPVYSPTLGWVEGKVKLE